MRYLNREDLRVLLHTRCIHDGTQAATGEALGISDRMVGDILNSKRLSSDLPDEALARLGVTREVRYFLTPKTSSTTAPAVPGEQD